MFSRLLKKKNDKIKSEFKMNGKDGENVTLPFTENAVVGIAGFSGVGKTALCLEMAKQTHRPVSMISFQIEKKDVIYQMHPILREIEEKRDFTYVEIPYPNKEISLNEINIQPGSLVIVDELILLYSVVESAEILIDWAKSNHHILVVVFQTIEEASRFGFNLSAFSALLIGRCQTQDNRVNQLLRKLEYKKDVFADFLLVQHNGNIDHVRFNKENI